MITVPVRRKKNFLTNIIKGNYLLFCALSEIDKLKDYVFAIPAATELQFVIPLDASSRFKPR